MQTRKKNHHHFIWEKKERMHILGRRKTFLCIFIFWLQDWKFQSLLCTFYIYKTHTTTEIYSSCYYYWRLWNSWSWNAKNLNFLPLHACVCVYSLREVKKFSLWNRPNLLYFWFKKKKKYFQTPLLLFTSRIFIASINAQKMMNENECDAIRL